MKNKLLTFLIVLFLAAAFTACDPDPEITDETNIATAETAIAVTGISLDTLEASLFEGGTQQLTAAIEPSDAENKTVTWSSSDTSIATVSDSGLVTAAGGVGSATITATTEDGSFTADCDIYTHQFKVAGDADTDDYFGDAITYSGDYLFIGAAGDDSGALSRAGSVYIFHRNEGGENHWGFVKKIWAEAPSASGHFGTSVAADGNVLLVGAHGESSYTGAAYIFYKDQGGTDNWGLVTKITGSGGENLDYFGKTTALSGDYALIGAYGYDGATNTTAYSGAAYLFHKDEGGTDNWGELKLLEAPTPAANEYFGNSIAISGDYIAAGDGRRTTGAGTRAGEVYIFYKDQDGTDAWGLSKTLDAGTDAADNGFFGISVSLSGNDLLIGAGGDDEKATDAGAAYIFNRNEGGDSNWGLVAKMTDANGGENDELGWPCTIAGNYAVVSAPYADTNGVVDSGAACVYYRNEGGIDNWGQVEKLTEITPTTDNLFGYSPVIMDSIAIIGVSDGETGSDPLFDSGSVYLFSIY